MQENLPVERLVRKALCAEEPIGRPGIRQLGIPQGAKCLEERQGQPPLTRRGSELWNNTQRDAEHDIPKLTDAVSG